jgi:hypothetical protein
MKIPAVLSTDHIDISAGGHVLVNIDGEPYAGDRQLGRSELRSVLDEITAGLGTAVRVEVREGDGTTYSDIATPPQAAGEDPPEAATPTSQPGVYGRGFQPGEEVAVAYVLCTQTAGADGKTTVHLPPTLLTRPGHTVVLIGMSSAAMAEIEQPA